MRHNAFIRKALLLIILATVIFASSKIRFCSAEVQASPQSNTLYFPLIKIDNGWKTDIGLTNSGTNEAYVSINAYDKFGNSISTVDGANTIKPGETIVISSTTLPFGTASLKVESDGTLVGNASFTSSDGKKSEMVPAIKSIAGQLIFPILTDSDFSNKKITVLNPNSTTVLIDIIALDANGAELDYKNQSISPMESFSFAVSDMFCGCIADKLSVVKVVPNSNSAGLQLVDLPNGDIVCLPALSTTSTGWIFPIQKEAEGFELWSKIGIFNSSSSPASISLKALDIDNQSLGNIDKFVLLPNSLNFVSTSNIKGTIPANASLLTVESTAPVSGYEVVGVVNGKGITAYAGIPEGDVQAESYKVETTDGGRVLVLHPTIRTADTSKVFNNDKITTLSTNWPPELIPNLNSQSYKYPTNPFAAKYTGQCTWFAWGRANEVMGINLLVRHAANTWINHAELPIGNQPQNNSIAVWRGDYTNLNGHVAYVERFDGTNVIINEANVLTYKKGGGYDGAPKTLSATAMKKRGTGIGALMGYIYLDNKLPLPGAVSAPNSDICWISSPQSIDVSCINADRIYYTISYKTDGTIPADPLTPTTANNYITGSSGNIRLYASAGQFKNIKLRFRGHNNLGYGPATDSYLYSIDLTAQGTATEIYGKLHKNSITGPALPGATVSYGTIRTTTDSNGNFSLKNVVAGSQTLYFSKAGYQPYQINSFNVTAGTAANAGDRWLVQNGEVYGKVHENSVSGPALPGVTVTYGSKSTTTNSYGNFSLQDVPAGSQTLYFSKSGYQPYQVDSFNLTPGTSANAGDRWLVKIPPTEIYGKVHQNSVSGPALSGATVSYGSVSTTTDGNGNFSLKNVAAGTQTLYFSKSGYQPYQINSFNVTTGTAANAGDRWLVQDGEVYGKVHDGSASGPALPGVTVTYGGMSTTTNSYGNFSLKDVPAGSQTLYFSKSGYQPFQIDSFNLTPGTSANAGDRWLVEVNPAISQSPSSGPPGTTFTQSGTGFSPSSTATLHFEKPDGTEFTPASQTISSNGNFSIQYVSQTNKAPGTYKWWAVDGPTGKISNKLSYTITVNPVVAQSPMSGPAGTTFAQGGNGFSPNSTAILHFQKPDGTEYTPSSQSIDSNGTFSIPYQTQIDKPAGTYTWWGVDGPTGKMSNKVSYTITSGYVSVSWGPWLSSYPVTRGQNFTIGFSLKERWGIPKTFEEVDVVVIDPNGNSFPFAKYYSVTIPANGSVTFTTPQNYIYTSRPTGTYKAVVKGLFNNTWFDFDNVDSGANPKSFPVN